MGRLDLVVHNLAIYQPAFGWREDAAINPRVHITVDDTYHFRTKIKRNTFSPSYEEKFVVGNTHRLAIIEIMVYSVTETSSFSLVREEKNLEERLIARTFVSIGRLVQGQVKTRNYYLGTIPRESENNLFAPPPRGVAGTITLSLTSEKLGEPNTALRLDASYEREYVERIKRLLLSRAPEDVAMIDPLIAHCRDSREVVRDFSSAVRSHSLMQKRGSILALTSGAKPLLAADATADALSHTHASSSYDLVTLGARTVLPPSEANLTLKPLEFHRPTTPESFEDVIRRLCKHYRTSEPEVGRLNVRLLGLTNLDKKALSTSLLGSDSVITVLRTPSEVYVANSLSLKETVVYDETTSIELEVIDPATFFVHILVLGKNGSDHYEIGRCNVSVATLALGHLSPRHMFLTSGDALYTALAFPAVVHLILEPLNFGTTPLELAATVDTYYDRLSRFFRRYDPVRVPSVDLLICSRRDHLDDFMNDLVVEHGREPGTVRLELTLGAVTALRESATVEAHRRDVVAVVSMGHSTTVSAVRTVRRFAACYFDECYTFDVVRETDMLRIEIVKASDPEVVYGRVEFTCLNTQRGVANERRLWLVGAAGTPDAYFSGIVRISMMSQEIGHPYEVDVAYENMMAGRLRRYAFRRIPETVHRVNLAVTTVFDMETFMAQLAARYGEEDPTYVIYFTITGCRRLRPRFGGINPYVVARVGVATYETKWVKKSTEPDYFEFCEFDYDRPGDNAITLVVMDHSDIGEDREIGHAVIPLISTQVNTQYNDFVSLISPDPNLRGKDIGAVGVKYTVFDTNLVDHTRTRLMQGEARRLSKGHVACAWTEGERRVLTLHAEDEGGRQPSQATTPSRGHSNISDDMVSNAAAATTRKRRDAGGALGSLSRWSRWMGGAWNSVRGAFHTSNQGGEVGNTSVAKSTSGVTSGRRGKSARRPRDGPINRTDLPSGAVSPEVLSRLPSAVSLSELNSTVSSAPRSDRRAASAAAKRPTHNLMDGGIASISEFCNHDLSDPYLPSSAASNTSLADMDGDRVSAHSNNSMSFPGSGPATPASTALAGTVSGTSSGTFPPCEERAGLAPQPKRSKTQRTGLSPSVRFTDACAEHRTVRHVRVRVLYCRNIANHSSQLPNPYLLLSTNCESRRTHVEFSTLQPQYQCEYVIRVEDPYRDSLSITVLSDTPFGSRKLGHCVLSLVNVQRGEFRTRWASLVVNSHEMTAEERGSVCVSMRGEDFGLDSIPAADAENRLRERIRSYLISERPEQLHLLEWFVGEYTRKEGFALYTTPQRSSRFLWGGLRNATPAASNDLRANLTRQLDKVFGHMSDSGGLGKPAKEKEATIQVTVHEVTHLYADDFLVSGSCQIKLTVEEHGRKTSKRTREVNGTEGDFVFEEEIPMVLKHPSGATSMRFAVTLDGRRKLGLCFASLSDLHRGVPQRRQYMLVSGANTSSPLITGYLTASILSEEYGSSEAAPTEEDEWRFDRLQSFFAYYIPREVATTALTYASTFNIEAYLRKLVEQHGPEPGDYNLRVTVDRCTDVHVTSLQGDRSASGGGGGGGSGNASGTKAGALLSPFCIVRCGLHEFHSGVVTGSTEFVFLESFDVTIHLPERDSLEFILMMHIPSQGKSEEIGRALVPLDTVVCGEPTALRLPIVHNPGTQHAEIKGTVNLSLFTEDFGENDNFRNFARTQSVFAITSTPQTSAAPSGTPEPPATGFHPRTASHVTGLSGPLGRRQTTTLPGAPSAHQSQATISAAGSPTQAPYVMFDATHAMVRGSPGRAVSASLNPAASTHSHTNADAGLSVDGRGEPGSLTSAAQSHTSRTAAVRAAQNAPIRLTILGIVFANNDVKPARDLYLRVTMGDNVLFRTKPMPADALSTLADGTFDLTDTSEVGYAMLTLKISSSQFMGKGLMCYADLTLSRCAPCTTEIRRLRLYHAETHQFLGICRLQVVMPDIEIVNAERPLKPKAVEPLLDDIASLFAAYSRKDLRRVTYALYKTPNEETTHSSLRQQLAPSVIGTFYLAVEEVELEGTAKNEVLVGATVGPYVAYTARRQTAATGILEFGMWNPDMQKLDFPIVRVDVSAVDEGARAITMRLCVYDTNKVDAVRKRTPLGAAVVSIRALLSPQLYDMSEPVTVSLVSVDRGSNRAHASLTGSITFRVYPPAYETYPRAARFPSSAVQTVSRTYVRYYLARIDRFLRHYDPNSLEQLHALVYDQYIENGKWESALPKMLTDLISRWGPEKGPIEPPPPLPPRDERASKSQSRAGALVKEASFGVLTPAFANPPGANP